jgi:hypothetical protein
VPGTHVCDGCKDAPRFGESVTVGIDPARDGSAAIAILRGGDVTIHGPIPARTVIGHVRDLHPEVTAEDLDRWAATRPQVGRTCGNEACMSETCARCTHEAACEVYDALPEACWQVHPGGMVPATPTVTQEHLDKVLADACADLDRERAEAEEYAGGWSALWAALTDVHRDLSAVRAALAAMDGDVHAGRASAYSVILARLLAVLTEHVPPWDRDAADLLPEVEPEEEPTEEAPEEVPVSLEDALADPTLPSYAQLGLAGVQRRRRRAQVIAGPERPTAVNVFVTGGGATDARTVANGIVHELTRRRKVAGR